MRQRLICILTALCLMLCSVPAYAAGEDAVQLGILTVSYEGNNGRLENMEVLVKDGFLYAKAAYLGEKFGYECYISTNSERGTYAAFYDEPAHRFVVFERENQVMYINSSLYLEYFTAPCNLAVAENTVWIPFHYALKLFDSDYVITSGVVNILKPVDTAFGIYYEKVFQQNSELWFDLVNEFGTNGLVAGMNHMVNVFDGLLSLDPSSFGQLFTQFFGHSSPYDYKYGDQLAALFCTKSQEEIRALTEYTSSVYDWMSNSGTLAGYMDYIDSRYSRDLSLYADQLRTLLGQENPNTFRLNKVSETLDSIADQSARWDELSAPVRDIQDQLSFSDSASDIINFATFGIDAFSYYSEFITQDENAVEALNGFVNYLRSSDSDTPEKTISAMQNYVNVSQSGTGGAAAYSLAKAFVEDISRTSDLASILSGSGFDLNQYLFGSGGSLMLAGWSLAKNIVPFIRDGLSSADSCEAALYAQVLALDGGNWRVSTREQMLEHYDDPDMQKEFVQAVYSFLKFSFIGRELALEMVSSLDSAQENQEYVQYLRSKNDKLLELMAVYSAAAANPSSQTLGFTRTFEAEFRAQYDDSFLIALVTSNFDEDVPEISVPDAPDTVPSIDERTLQAYEKFIQKRGFQAYTDNWEAAPYSYAILDIDQNQIPELLINSATIMDAWYSTLLFTYNPDLNEVILVKDIYHYDDICYSQNNQAIVYAELRPFPAVGGYNFYALDGIELKSIQSVGWDTSGDGTYSFIATSGDRRKISFEEREAILLGLSPIPSEPLPVGPSQSKKLDLIGYLGTDIYEFGAWIGDMSDSGATDGGVELSNGQIVASAAPWDLGETTISYIAIDADCDYSIAGVEYGMLQTNAQELLLREGWICVDGVLPRLDFKREDGVTIALFASDGNFIDGISLFAASN